MTGEEKEGKKEKGVNPSVSGVNGTQEIFARMQDFSDKWYTSLRDALFDLRRGVAKVLVVNLDNPTRYVYITLDYANHNFFYVKQFSEDQVFKGDYSGELQKMTEEQVYGLLQG